LLSRKASLVENPKNIQVQLDGIDRELLRELSRNARISNAELAAKVGIAASTCLGRVRSLVEQRVIKSFNAEISSRESWSRTAGCDIGHPEGWS
jgi:DNA-binding Lrp family transcriptional regulator